MNDNSTEKDILRELSVQLAALKGSIDTLTTLLQATNDRITSAEEENREYRNRVEREQREYRQRTDNERIEYRERTEEEAKETRAMATAAQLMLAKHNYAIAFFTAAITAAVVEFVIRMMGS